MIRLAFLPLLALAACGPFSCTTAAVQQSEMLPGVPEACGTPPHSSSGMQIDSCEHAPGGGPVCCAYQGLIVNDGYVYACMNLQCQPRCGAEWMVAGFACDVQSAAPNSAGRWDGTSTAPEEI